MKRRCDERGIAFMCTAHDDTVLPWLDELDVAAFKIGSGERGNTAYFRKIASRGKPVILSTGMYRRTDVEEAVAVFAETGCRDLGLLHCVTSYPTPPDQINLRAMEVLREVFPGVVGYSDHTCGHQVPLAAVALGAAIVEKHITLDFDVPNAQDWKVSAGPDDFADFVKAVRDVQRALGNAAKEPQPCEQGALEWALKSLVASRALAAGTVLAEADLVAKRPGGGVPPSRLAEVAGRTLARAVEPDQALSWDDLT